MQQPLTFAVALDPSENCALDKNGNLKDASEIQFFNDPDDDTPLPAVSSAKLCEVDHVPSINETNALQQHSLTPGLIPLNSHLASGWLTSARAVLV
jgi:hypothetical protein